MQLPWTHGFDAHSSMFVSQFLPGVKFKYKLNIISTKIFGRSFSLSYHSKPTHKSFATSACVCSQTIFTMCIMLTRIGITFISFSLTSISFITSRTITVIPKKYKLLAIKGLFFSIQAQLISYSFIILYYLEYTSYGFPNKYTSLWNVL